MKVVKSFEELKEVVQPQQETKRRVKKATHDQVIDINDKLREVLIQHEDGTVEYKEGWSDESVAAMFDASPNSVSYIRTTRYGSFKKQESDDLSALRKRVSALETRLAKLEESLGV